MTGKSLRDQVNNNLKSKTSIIYIFMYTMAGLVSLERCAIDGTVPAWFSATEQSKCHEVHLCMYVVILRGTVMFFKKNSWLT